MTIRDYKMYELFKFNHRIKSIKYLKLKAIILIEILNKIFDKQRRVTIPEKSKNTKVSQILSFYVIYL